MILRGKRSNFQKKMLPFFFRTFCWNRTVWCFWIGKTEHIFIVSWKPLELFLLMLAAHNNCNVEKRAPWEDRNLFTLYDLSTSICKTFKDLLLCCRLINFSLLWLPREVSFLHRYVSLWSALFGWPSFFVTRRPNGVYFLSGAWEITF